MFCQILFTAYRLYLPGVDFVLQDICLISWRLKSIQCTKILQHEEDDKKELPVLPWVALTATN